MYDLFQKICLFIIKILYYQSIYCTILFIIIFGLTLILKNKSLYWQFGLWFLIIIRLLLPTDLNYSLSARNLINNTPWINNVTVSLEEISRKLEIDLQPDQNKGFESFKPLDGMSLKKNQVELFFNSEVTFSHIWPLLIVIVWFIGSLFFLIIFLKKIYRFNLVINRASLIQDKKIIALIMYWRHSFKVKRSVKAYSSNDFLSPFTVGLFKPKVFIPQALLKSIDAETINSIIAHEMVHIKRLDDLWIKLQNALQIIYFFHPVVWFVNRQINLTRERICDSKVLTKKIISPKNYGKGLLNVLKLNLIGSDFSEPFPGFGNHKKIFEQRINHIIREDAIKNHKPIYVYIAVCLLGLFLLPLSDSQTSSAQSENMAGSEKVEFIKPMYGWLTIRFGYKNLPFTDKKVFHQAIDIANRIGTPMYAVASGIVENVEFSELIGKVVTLRHNGGFKSIYTRCDKILVQERQHVKSGDVIATCGNSGTLTTEPHLHFELKKDGKAVDPLEYIKW